MQLRLGLMLGNSLVVLYGKVALIFNLNSNSFGVWRLAWGFTSYCTVRPHFQVPWPHMVLGSCH